MPDNQKLISNLKKILFHQTQEGGDTRDSAHNVISFYLKVVEMINTTY